MSAGYTDLDVLGVATISAAERVELEDLYDMELSDVPRLGVGLRWNVSNAGVRKGLRTPPEFIGPPDAGPADCPGFLIPSWLSGDVPTPVSPLEFMLDRMPESRPLFPVTALPTVPETFIPVLSSRRVMNIKITTPTVIRGNSCTTGIISVTIEIIEVIDRPGLNQLNPLNFRYKVTRNQ